MKNDYVRAIGLRGGMPFRKGRVLLTVVLCVVGLLTVSAQELKRIPGKIITCPAPEKIEPLAASPMGMFQMQAAGGNVLENRPVTADIQVTFGPGASGNAEVEAAFRFALDIWSREIVSSVPIQVFADFANLGPGVLASAGPTELVSNFPNAPEQDVFYPIALANSLAGQVLNSAGNTFDLQVNLGNGIPFYFGTDGNPPPGQFDFVTIALHEACHGLGFIDGGTVDGAGVGSINGGGDPFIFDLFVVDGAGNSVLDLPNPSTALGDFYTSGDVFANGEAAVEALEGVVPELFAPNPFQGGSSIAHWDEATFPAGDPNSLMTPQAAPAESNFDVGEITRGHFSDMGWVLSARAPVNVVPGNVFAEVNVGETVAIELTVTNISGAEVNVSAVASDNAVTIGAIEPAAFTLAVDGSQTVVLTLSAENVLAGIFEEAVIFSGEGVELTFEVPTRLRVLDGTEAPIIAVDPTSFDETIQQFQIVNRDLTISNLGNDDLNFTLTVEGDDVSANTVAFSAKAQNMDALIASQGFEQVRARPANNGIVAAQLQTIDGTFNQINGNLFAEDFENLLLGDILDQGGWFARFVDNWVVSDANAFEGVQHLRGISDGLGPGQPQAPLALSPTFELGNLPISILTAQVNLEGSGVSWEIIPQNTLEGSVVTRLRFNGDGTVDILDAGFGAFVPIDVQVPEGYFAVRIEIDRDTLALSVFFDDVLVHSGIGFATAINNVALLSDLAVVGSTFDVDNLEVSDSNPTGFFVSVAPEQGSIAFDGGDETATVTFDTRALEPGVFNATINVASDDPENPLLEIPVTLNVVTPPSITVTPDSLSASVDVQTDNPPTDVQSIIISNSGQSPLNFSSEIGLSIFTPPGDASSSSNLANLDRSIYGGGNGGALELKVAEKLNNIQRASISSTVPTIANATTAVADSIFYDSGVDFPGSFVGFGAGGPGLTAGILFDVVNDDFVLTSVRNAYQTDGLAGVNILLQIYRGGETPDQGELLLEQVVTGDSPNGVFAVETLERPISFSAGESFWVVHSYPQGIDFPQGFDDTITTTRPNTYVISADGGQTFADQGGFAFLTRALSEQEVFISLSPETGTVAPGEELEVAVTFDGSNLANGTYQADIFINSDDPENPVSTVATNFEVSGQVSGISVSEELLLFNDVFIGNTATRTFTITNTGNDILEITDIVSDNPEFTISPTSGQLIANEQLLVTVTFSPESSGNSNGIITFESNAADETRIIVNGVGVIGPFAVLDPERSEVTVAPGESLVQEITLRNEGEAPLIYSFPEFTMANALADPNANFQQSQVLDFPNFSSTQQKGFVDSRVGGPVSAAMGTDLNFGYTWIDSDEPGGPVNNFLDISGIGQDITAPLLDPFGFSDATVSLTLPFNFPFYGEEQSTLFINGNGFLAFQEPTSPLTFVQQQIPVNDDFNNIIAPFWHDLEAVPGNGSVHIAGNEDLFIVQWTDAPGAGGLGTGSVTFQIILFSDGTIDVYYDNVDTASFLELASIGIENADGSDGAQVVFNAPYVRDGLALRFIPPLNTDFITEVAPLSGIVPAGGEQSISVTLDASNLPEGVFEDELNLSSNSPDLSRSTAFFELNVAVPPVIEFVLIDARSDEAIAPILDGQVIDLADFPLDARFNIEAVTGEIIAESVVFDFNGEAGFRTDNEVPYALGGERDGNFRSLSLPLGNNELTATTFSEDGGQGEAGVSTTINFEVVNSRVPVLDFVLIDASTDAPIRVLTDGEVIDLGSFPEGTTFNIEAVPSEVFVESVVFELEGRPEFFRVENRVPYAFGGDRRGDFRPVDLPLGSNALTATGFSRNRGRGEETISETINFEVIDSSAPEIGFVLINASTNQPIGPLSDGDVIDVSKYPSGTRFSIEAETGDLLVESVVFDLNGDLGFNTENLEPYTLAGDFRGIFSGVRFPAGQNTVTATAYSGNRGTGEVVASVTIGFRVEGEGSRLELSLYPNPAGDEVFVSIPDGPPARLKATLINFFGGRTVLSDIDVDLESNTSVSLDVSSVPTGLYILQLRNEGGQVVAQGKLLKR